MTLIKRTLAVFALLAFFAVPAQAQDAEESAPTIVEIAQQVDGFSTLVAALQAGDLVGALQGEGPFTVFAPTDSAFAALPEGTLESLLQPENKERLQAILQYHVVPANAMASDVVGMDAVTTLQGSDVSIQVENGTVTLMGQNAATVTQTDIEASNGVIHVIDSVLLPPEKEDM